MNDNYSDVLNKEIKERLKALREGLNAQKEMPDKLDQVVEKVDQLQQDVQIIKSIIPDHSGPLKQTKKDIQRLQAKFKAV